MIKPILYERIEQKNEIERELFSKLTAVERRAVAKSWTKLISMINQPPLKKLPRKKSTKTTNGSKRS